MHVEKHFQEQIERIDRLMEIVLEKDPTRVCKCLTFLDVLIFTFQSMWHLKDWILGDDEFLAADINQVKQDIHKDPSLLICADLANCSKHFRLSSTKTDLLMSDRKGLKLDLNSGAIQEFYYIVSSDYTHPYHGMEVRDLLVKCRSAWQVIIDKHYLSATELLVKK